MKTRSKKVILCSSAFLLSTIVSNVSATKDNNLSNSPISGIKRINYFMNDSALQKDTIKSNKISQRGIEAIKYLEYLSLKSFRIKGENSNTIGYGHKISSSDELWLRRKYVGESITKSQAEEILKDDIENFVNPALNRLCNDLSENNIYLNQNEKDALCSLIYNCGPSGIKSSLFYKELKNGNKKKAIELIKNTHIYMKGHILRRSLESNMMLGNFDFINK